METQGQLKKAADCLANGDRDGARSILDNLLAVSPKNDQAWLLLFSALDKPSEKHDCLRNAVQANPRNEQARQKLEKYSNSAEYRAYRLAAHKARENETDNRRKRTNTVRVFQGILSFLGYILHDLFGHRGF
jgi:hypothetical protein